MSNKSNRYGIIFFKLVLFVFFILVLICIYNFLFKVKESQPKLGFCIAQNRQMPDEFFIEKAVNLNRENRLFDGQHYSLINCCIVHRLDNQSTWLGYLTSMAHLDGGVQVQYVYEKSQKQREDEEKNAFSELHKYRYSVGGSYFDSCGNLRHWNSDYADSFRHSLGFDNAIRDKYVKEEDVPQHPLNLKEFVKWQKDGNQIIK